MSTVRLDKYVSSALILSRKNAFSVIRAGRISVNGSVLKKADAKVDPSSDEVTFDGEKLVYSKFVYVMLNKPSGLICASYDAKEKTVFSLFPKEYADKGINCVGRLDKDACGLLLMTNDGILSHKLLSPKNAVSKKYFVTCDKPFSESDKEIMKNGIIIDGKRTSEAKLEISKDDEKSACVTLTEGKFHEVKRLCYACGQKEVVFLKRVEFASLILDGSLKYGEWRSLTEDEIKKLKSVTEGER
ncbi:MAG: rRNA pseudouridine synthase [Clostridia bacterium]|nr:rRNA pseudouridine synthase [Clostridia bacterium]